MTAPAAEIVYRYPFASDLGRAEGRPQLRLATSGGAEAYPYFFRGTLTEPKKSADLLLVVAKAAQSRFYVPPATVAKILREADPVVTSDGSGLRFEAFSQCCGLYARADFLPNAIEGSFPGKGTTNVDFNLPMREALSGIRAGEEVQLRVGQDEVELERPAGSVVERKVALTQRWLKGFVEVQSYAPRLTLRAELTGPEARRLLSTFPRQVKGRDRIYLVPCGPTFRMSQRSGTGAIPVGGIGRLHLVGPLLRNLKSLRVYADPDTWVTGWDLDLAGQHLQVILSPAPARGFSGEGQALLDLARDDEGTVLSQTRAALRWQRAISAANLAEEIGGEEAAVSHALAALGTRGLVGYDLREECYYHRVLPFDLSTVEALHPRLKAARALVAEDGVRFASESVGRLEAYVRGSGLEHHVVLEDEAARCSCPWYNRMLGEAGPCKHILAARLARGEGP